jgi:tetratricopeptide (TPR) repeat protein
VKLLLSNAEGFFFSKRYEEAIAGYAAVLAEDPANAAAYRCRAAAHAVLGRDAAALADYERAVTLDPRFDEAWLGRGLYFFSKGRYAEAIDDFDKTIALDPRDYFAHLYKALACEKIGRLREAAIARQAYIHCEIPREEGGTADQAVAPREVTVLGLQQ